ncbi:MAG TPA: hypothetical protein VK694_00935 [Verrucomicrobiae bacterium]|nr:hypothetical protein [Verrucomicrobiae bacterium]
MPPENEMLVEDMQPGRLERWRQVAAKATGVLMAATVALMACSGGGGEDDPAAQATTETTSITQETDTTVTQPETTAPDPTNRYMHFVDMPTSREAARDAAVAAAPGIKFLTDQGIAPMVMFEHGGVDLHTVEKDTFVSYFQTLKENGITDQTIGTWALFPEPNIPEWGVGGDKGNTDPETFKENFVTVATALKEVFPEARVALLLNNVSWQNHDTGYTDSIMSELDDQGKEIDPQTRIDGLLAYVQGLPPGLVDEFHFQGLTFPNETDPALFLNAEAAIAVARALGVQDVVLNTGTFAETNPEHLEYATLTPVERRDILLQILEQAKVIKAAGFNVTLNVFAENKYADEANWAYETPEELDALNEFLAAAAEAGIPVITFEG